MKRLNRRQRTILLFMAALLLLLLLLIVGSSLQEAAQVTDFERRNLTPSPRYPFGTDWLGRDMFLRSLSGLALSLRIGLLTASISALIALALGTAAALLGRVADAVISWLIDLFMGIPHLLLLVLICFATGRGFGGVVLGITLTHWMALARLIRGEILQLRQSGYVQVAQKLGVGRLTLARRHLLPHLWPQFLVGLILLFPHAILHEASITFLGFGLPPEQPALGIILSESLTYLTLGRWWLALFPGLLLIATVLLFDLAGNCLRKLIDPGSAQE